MANEFKVKNGLITPNVNKVSVTTPATGSTLTIVDGATLTASATANVSGTNSGDQNVVNSVVVSGQTTISTSGNTALTVVAGTNITLTTNNATKTLTIASSGAAGSIDLLTDVDTSTVAPTNDQVLTWQSSGSKWVPKTATGGSGNLSQVMAFAAAMG